MTDFLKLTDTLSVAPQIFEDDITKAASEGFGMIINNRPDGEEAGQPTNAELAEVAANQGIKWAHIPVVGGQLTMEGIEQMAFALRDGTGDSSDGRVLAYCRSGTRSCTLWGLSEAYTGGMETDRILHLASSAGYDLSGMAPTLEHLRQSAGSQTQS